MPSRMAYSLEAFLKRRQFCFWFVVAMLFLSLPLCLLTFLTFNEDSASDGSPYQIRHQRTVKGREELNIPPPSAVATTSASTAEEIIPTPTTSENLLQPRQTRVAILVLDDENESIDGFYRSAVTYLLHSDRINVTYFLFFRSLNKFLRQQMIMDEYEKLGLGLVHILTYVREDERNPCRVYLENAGHYRYFTDSKFDYVISFDPRLLINRPIGLVDELLDGGELVAAIHPSFQEFTDKALFPYDRRHNSCAYVPLGSEAENYYSAELFVGKPSIIEEFCDTVSLCHYSPASLDEIKFHQAVNHYFVKNPPNRVLPRDYIHPSSIGNSPDPAIILRDSSVKAAPRNQRYLFAYDAAFFEAREKRVQTLVNTLRKYYLKQMARGLGSRQKAQFIGYYCAPSERQCGGFAAIRGAGSLLYFSIATERIFHLIWLKPADASSFFAVNEKLYNVSSSLYENKRLASSQHALTIPPSKADSEKKWPISFAELRSYDSLLIGTNRTHSLMATLFAKRQFYPGLHRGIPDIPDYKGSLEYSVYFSAAIRVVFGRLVSKAEELLEDTILRMAGTKERWAKAAKIGIQIRTCSECRSERVQFYQLVCFADKVRDIIRQELGQVPRFVFVTSDTANTSVISSEIRQHLESMQESDDRVTVFDSASILSTLQVEDDEEEGQWREMAAPFLDWYLLTRMDWLLISRSNFGETASLFSLKPTERYNHGILDNTTCLFDWYNHDITLTEAL